MKNKAIACALSCAGLLGLGATASAQSTGWQPTLVVAEGKIRSPSDPVHLLLPPLPVTVLQNIALELDNVDVTGLVSTTDGRDAVFMPPQPLAYGEHSLRLVEHAADGRIIERGTWTLDVRKSALFRDASAQADITLNGSTRIADENLPKPMPSRNQANGAAQFKGALVSDRWRTEARMDLVGNSQRVQQADKLDLGQFLLTAETGPLVAQAGDQVVGPESLVMQNFNRRGVSAGVRSQGGSSVTAFAMRTSGLTGFNQGLGVGDEENRTEGVIATARPLADPEALVLWATYLTAEGPDQAGSPDSGIAGDTSATNGNAWSVAGDSQWFERRLRVRGEIAQTHFDFDGDGRDTDLDGVIDSNLPEESGRAHAALVVYTPWHDKQVGGKPLALNLGMENRQIGTYFRSPANPVGVADRDLWRAFTNLNWSGLDLQLSSARETDNVDDVPLLPQTETRQHYIAASYTPTLELKLAADGQTPLLPWFGQPSFSASRLNMQQDVTKPASVLAEGTLREASTTTLGASFMYTSWYWAVNQSISDTEERAAFAPDTHAYVTQLSASFRIGSKLTLTPTLQRSDVEERDPPVESTDRDVRTTTAGAAVDYLLSETVTTGASYMYNRQHGGSESADATTNDVSARISWAAFPPSETRPGITLSLEGSYHEQTDGLTTFGDDPAYQVFMKAAIGWSPRF